MCHSVLLLLSQLFAAAIKSFYSSGLCCKTKRWQICEIAEDGGTRDLCDLGGPSGGSGVLQRLRGAVLQRVPAPLPLTQSQEEAAVPLL